MKPTSLLTFSGFAAMAFAPSLMAEDPIIQAQAVEIEPVPEISVCRMRAPISLIDELKDIEANEEAIHFLIQKGRAKTTIEKLNAPLVIQSMEEANKHLTRASMEKISVDFEKQQMVIFAWQGSGQDRLGGHLPASKDAVANFHYTQGRTKDLKTHSIIYAMPKGTELKVNEQPRIIRCGVPDGGVEMKIEPMKLQRGEELKLQLKAAPAPKAE